MVHYYLNYYATAVLILSVPNCCTVLWTLWEKNMNIQKSRAKMQWHGKHSIIRHHNANKGGNSLINIPQTWT